MVDRQYFIYIATNPGNTVLYTGVTNSISRRMWEHKQKLVEGFTKKYNVNKLVYTEVYTTALEAITREKQIKGWVRSKKIILIEKDNPQWKDLSDTL